MPSVAKVIEVEHEARKEPYGWTVHDDGGDPTG